MAMSPIITKSELESSVTNKLKEKKTSFGKTNDNDENKISKQSNSSSNNLSSSSTTLSTITTNYREKEFQFSFIYIKDDKDKDDGENNNNWIPGFILDCNYNSNIAKVMLHPKTATIHEKIKEYTATDNANLDHDNNNESSGISNDDKNIRIINLKEYEHGILPLQNVDKDGNVIIEMDMTNLSYLHEAALLYNLKYRYEGYNITNGGNNDVIVMTPYTRASRDILISINPYRWIRDLYSKYKQNMYSRKILLQTLNDSVTIFKDLEPHIFEVSAQAFKGMMNMHTDTKQNQSILVTGESGAGKTVSVKFLMSHLATLADYFTTGLLSSSKSSSSAQEEKDEMNMIHADDGHTILYDEYNNIEICCTLQEDVEPTNLYDTNNNSIVQCILDCNPLLEAFGNAKTIRCDNSSRFGKYTKLQYMLQNKNVKLVGSKCETFLLEKSRVVLHSQNERSFHIFYQMLNGASKMQKSYIWSELLNENDSGTTLFKYLSNSTTNIADAIKDESKWYKTIQALEMINVKDELLHTLLKALCIVLQLGNITFDARENDKCYICNTEELNKLCILIGLDNNELQSRLTTRMFQVKDTIIPISRTCDGSKDVCDALAKEIYSVIFNWLVYKLNDTISVDESDDDTTMRYIGLLDIFGFEIFEQNYFEQLCINHANEKLQRKFIEDIFVSVQEEYKQEGIDIDEIQYEDNSHIINLIEGPLGLIDLLNEECVRPKGNNYGFVNKLYHNNGKNNALLDNTKYQKIEFGIKHYAASVKYNANQIVTKNMDTLPKDLIKYVSCTSNNIISSQFKKMIVLKNINEDNSNNNNSSNNNSTIKSKTVWTKFKNQLTDMLNEINESKSRYVRCINPNTSKSPGIFDSKHCMRQLRTSGLVSAITVSRSSFPNRLPYESILGRFDTLVKCCYYNSKNSVVDNEWEKRDLFNNDKERATYLLDCLLQDYYHGSHDTTTTIDTNIIETSKTKSYVCGNNKVYFRAGVLEYIENQLFATHNKYAYTLQKSFKSLKFKRDVKRRILLRRQKGNRNLLGVEELKDDHDDPAVDYDICNGRYVFCINVAFDHLSVWNHSEKDF